MGANGHRWLVRWLDRMEKTSNIDRTVKNARWMMAYIVCAEKWGLLLRGGFGARLAGLQLTQGRPLRNEPKSS